MERKVASELRSGDVFYRDHYREPDPATDWLSKYTVQSVQRFPQRDFYGKIDDMVRITAHNQITGPAILSLGAEETVWLTR